MDTSAPTPPPGFEPVFRTSPFIDLVGPVYSKREGRKITIGLRVAEKHCNARGTVHGGLYMTLADIALGYNAVYAGDPPARLTTVSITTDFAGSAKIGDWIEIHVDVQRVGGKLAFANAYVHVGDQRIVRASAVFSRTQEKAPPLDGA
jgi:acyl-coenzyme A thioesterase 13